LKPIYNACIEFFKTVRLPIKKEAKSRPEKNAQNGLKKKCRRKGDGKKFKVW